VYIASRRRARARPLVKVAIAGASGFVGRALWKQLLEDGHEVVALSRRARVGMRRCDLFSLPDTEAALEGVDVAVYLVHSMMPSARLTQASFEDLDLILADNFARAAERCGVRQLVYLGGFVPEVPESDLSTHLRSRLEVERTLASRTVPLTALRAGLIVGPGGSSLRILVNLVRRLPAMITPAWTENATQPIALRDVMRAFSEVVGQPERYEGSFDIGGPEVMTYKEMLARTGSVLGAERPMLGVPFFSTGLSKLWVSLVTGVPMELVGPLVDSLQHAMVGRDNPLQQVLATDLVPYEASLEAAASRPGESQRSRLGKARRTARDESLARSVQRLPHPGQSATWVADEYMRWLPSIPVPGLCCEIHDETVYFTLRGLATPLLMLERRRSDDSLARYAVTGGLLSRGDRGRLEFRSVLDDTHVLAAVHDFRPSLPWYVYNATQALVHLWVMRAFGRHLDAHTDHVEEGATEAPSRREPVRATDS